MLYEDRVRFTAKRNYTVLKRVVCRCVGELGFTTKRNYTVLKPQIHGAENTLFLQNRVISADISGKTAQIPIYHEGFFTFEKFGNTMFN